MSETVELTAEDREYIEKVCQAIRNKNKDALKTLHFFKGLDNVQLDEVFNAMLIMTQAELMKALEKSLLAFREAIADVYRTGQPVGTSAAE